MDGKGIIWDINTIKKENGAIQLLNKLGHYIWVIAELGYPSRGILMLWVKEYKSTG